MIKMTYVSGTAFDYEVNVSPYNAVYKNTTTVSKRPHRAFGDIKPPFVSIAVLIQARLQHVH